jgi:hypothetical protein
MLHDIVSHPISLVDGIQRESYCQNDVIRDGTVLLG